jgi:hypothetical protein
LRRSLNMRIIEIAVRLSAIRSLVERETAQSVC